MSWLVMDILKMEPTNLQNRPLPIGAAPSTKTHSPLTSEAFLTLDTRAVAPPLVTLILINFNYARFIGAAIDSIKAQDYRNFECVVIDNGSTDNSSSVIETHIEGDDRFTYSQLPENLGQLGASLWAIERIRGSFVVFVDADDLLFPSFCSTHVQAHLALPEKVAFTSSNIVEINKTGSTLTGKSSRINIDTAGFIKGLRPAKGSPRLSTIDDETYALLNTRCAIVPKTYRGKYWTPGTSNMYRASMIKLLQIGNDERITNRPGDNYFRNMSHCLGQSALIDLPLSAYRIHGGNYWAYFESINDIKQHTLTYDVKSNSDYRHNQELVLIGSVEFHRLSGNIWHMIDFMSKAYDQNGIKSYYSDPIVVAMFVKYSAELSAALTQSEFYSGLANRFGLINGLKISIASDRKRWIYKSLGFLKSMLKQNLYL
jgi:glycosyltransferase involved in cell wall biosynthesis